MQSSGGLRRENAKSYSIVIVREGGRSSIPETSVIETRGRGVLDPPPSRRMTNPSNYSHMDCCARNDVQACE